MFLRALILVCLFTFNFGLHTSYAQITANFSSPNLEACGSLQTTFFDQSTSVKSIISWAWDLGGNSSSKQNPGAIFTEPGQYTICLTVTDIDGNSDTEYKENYIKILPSPVSGFEADNPSVPYNWDFGNGTTYEGSTPPVVNYLDVGVYALEIINSNGVQKLY
jgi:PKD repeat protein